MKYKLMNICWFLALLLYTKSDPISTQSTVWIGDFSNFPSGWNIQKSYLAENRQVVNDPKGGSDKVLRVTYPAGTYTGEHKGGTGFYVVPFGNLNPQKVLLQYQVLFPSGFEWVKGGKLPGLFGGDFSCSGGSVASNCFSARFMWSRNGDGFSYLYVDKDSTQTAEFCALNTAPSCSPHYG